MTEGVQVGSRYRATDMIGQGSFGTVFRGHGPAGPVAIKLLRPDLAADPDLVDRFLRERSLLLRLRHPNLVSVHDLVAESDLLALVMDLIDGPDLRAYLARRGPLPAALAAELVAGVADALAHTHAAGVIHRDLKPENVLLRLAQDGPVPLLTDFGIARLAAVSSSVTGPQTVIGTPGYLAPEIARGQPATPSVDVYGCGVLLYELITGRPPFAGDHALAVIHRQLTETPERPERLADEQWSLIARCLSVDPANRPTAAELAAALRGRPVPGRQQTMIAPLAVRHTSALPVTGPGPSHGHAQVTPVPHTAPEPAGAAPRAVGGGWPLRIAMLL
ncbi:MAG: serine/threonine-protein kinase, partial [Actinocatenispora sp.]